jgi:hypothetical protein
MANDLPIHLRKIQLFNETPVSIGTYTSVDFDVEDAISYSVQFVWDSGSVFNGTIYLQATNDGKNYTQIQQTILTVSGASGNHMINVEKPAYSSVQLVALITAGTANISATANAKRQ